MKWILICAVVLSLVFGLAQGVLAQAFTTKAVSTQSATASKNANNLIVLDRTSTKLLFQRDVTHLKPFNVLAYGVHRALAIGIPQESMVLILFIPFLATLVVFFRYIIGFNTLGIAPTITVAITFFVTGLPLGTILFVTLLLVVGISRIVFKKIRIMQLTKVSLSMFVISLVTILTLVASLHFGFIKSSDISIFPILLFILISERVVAIQLENDLNTAFGITLLTFILGVGGYLAISTLMMRSILLVYPEVLLLLLPINWFIGRYFGLRVTEYFRFVPNIHYGNK